MTIELERRAFVQAGVALAAGAAVAAAVAPAAAQTAGPAPAAPKPMTFDVKPMPFDPGQDQRLVGKDFTSHYANNYTGAVKRLNEITEQLAGLDYAKAPGDPDQRAEARGIDRHQFHDIARSLLCGAGSKRAAPARRSPRPLPMTSALSSGGAGNSLQWARPRWRFGLGVA